jgi:hypothetical protein
LLHNIGVNEFAELLILDSRPNGRLLAAMCARYEHDARSNDIVHEHSWLTSLVAEVNARASRETPPYKQLLEKRLKYYFDRISQSVAEAEEAALRASGAPQGEAS